MIHLYDNVYLFADRLNFILAEKHMRETGKNIGEEIWKNKKFFPNMEFLLAHLCSAAILKCFNEGDITTLKKIETTYNTITNEFKRVSEKVENIHSFVDSFEDLKEK